MFIKNKIVSKRILIVEDSLIIVTQVKIILKNAGFGEVESVASSEEALKKIRANHFDLIIMDIFIHGLLTGVEVYDKIKETCFTPVIFISGRNLEEIELKVPKPVNKFFLKKPFRNQELLNMVRTNLAELSPDIF